MTRLLAGLCVVIAVAGCGNPPDSSVDPIPGPSSRSQNNKDADGASGAHQATSSYPTQVFWGDTHLHTSDSADAFACSARASAPNRRCVSPAASR